MLISRNYLPRYTVWCNLTIFSANEISKMRLSGEMIEVCFFHMGCYRNICLWFKIVFPLAGSMARYMSPIHIQPNVTISGIVCSSYQEHQIASPRWCSQCFLLISVWVCMSSKEKTLRLSQFSTNYLPWNTCSLETHNNTWINGFFKLLCTSIHILPIDPYDSESKLEIFFFFGIIFWLCVCVWMRKQVFKAYYMCRDISITNFSLFSFLSLDF